MDEIKQTIKKVKKEDWYQGQVEHIEELPEKKPKFKEIEIKDEIRRYLEEKIISP